MRHFYRCRNTLTGEIDHFRFFDDEETPLRLNKENRESGSLYRWEKVRRKRREPKASKNPRTSVHRSHNVPDDPRIMDLFGKVEEKK